MDNTVEPSKLDRSDNHVSSFLLRMSNKAPWELNYVLAPGAIVAVAVGFITDYGEYYYAATLLGVNVIFYGLLAHIVLSLTVLRPRATARTR